MHLNPAPAPARPKASPDLLPNYRRASTLPTWRRPLPARKILRALQCLRTNRWRRPSTISQRWRTSSRLPCGGHQYRKAGRKSLTRWLLRPRRAKMTTARRGRLSASCAPASSRNLNQSTSQNSNRSLNRSLISNPRLVQSRRPPPEKTCTKISKRRWPVCWAVRRENRDSSSTVSVW